MTRFRGARALFVAVLVVALGSMAAVPANAAAGGTISGRLLAQDGSPIEMGTVSAYTLGGAQIASTGSWLPGGYFFLNDVPAGSYKLEYLTGQVGLNTVSPWYSGNDGTLASAPTVTVTGGSTTDVGTKTIPPGATISGVLSTADGSPLNPYAVLTDVDGAGGFGVLNTSPISTSSASYTLTGLRSGTYVLQMWDNFDTTIVPEYWQNALAIEDATPIVVTSQQQRSGFDAVLAARATVSGTVTATTRAGQTGPQMFIDATLFTLDGVASQWATTSSNGKYTILGVDPGEYYVRFSDSGGTQTFITEWLGGSHFMEGSQTIVVPGSPATIGVDAQLEQGSTVSGTVVFPNNTKDATVFASAMNPSTGEYEIIAGAHTNPATGAYTVGGLFSGDYILQFLDAANVVASQYWFSSPDAAHATTVDVGTQVDLTGYNWSAGFADVGIDHAFRKEIAWMLYSGYSNGFIEGGQRLYKPAQDISREAIAAFLYRFSGSPAFTPPAEQSFVDVPPSHLFFKEIEWMKAQTITNGSPVEGGVAFAPSDPLTRQAMAAFLYRLAGRPAYTPPVSASFADVPVDSPFRLEIEWMKAEGLTNGYPDGFHPTETVSRQAMAAFLYRFAH